LPLVDPDLLDAWLDKQLIEPCVGPESCGAGSYARDRMDRVLALGNLFR
jgi:hypothetical protein